MPDDATPPATDPSGTTPPATGGGATSNVRIPDEIKAQFPDLITLILGSESMNDEERQYWVNILPIMTPEQLDNLRDILENEKQQLAAIDAKYDSEVGRINQEQQVTQFYNERKQRRSQRSQAESQARVQESEATDDVLKQIEEL